MSDDDSTYSAIKTVLGTTRRDQHWHLTDEVDITTVLGRSRFDLRDVETSGQDVVEVEVTCLLGGVDLIVPVGTVVVLDGTSFLAAARSRVAAGASSALPRLEVTATTVLGRVRVRSLDEDLVDAVALPTDDTAPGAPDAALPADVDADAGSEADAA